MPEGEHICCPKRNLRLPAENQLLHQRRRAPFPALALKPTAPPCSPVVESVLLELSFLPPTCEKMEILKRFLDDEFSLFLPKLKVLKIRTCSYPYRHTHALLQMNSKQGAQRVIDYNNDRVAQGNCERPRGWSRPLTLQMLQPHEPEEVWKDAVDEDALSIRCTTSAQTSFLEAPAYGYSAYPHGIPAGTRSHSEAPPLSPVGAEELFVKGSNGEYISIGKLNISKLSLGGSAGLKRVSSTTTIQQTCATVTTVQDPHAENSFHGSVNQGTPLPGLENSKNQLYSWNLSPIATSSPAIVRSMPPPKFYPEQNTDQILRREHKAMLRESLNEMNESFTARSFQSQELSMTELRSDPDWLTERPRVSRELQMPKQTSFVIDDVKTDLLPLNCALNLTLLHVLDSRRVLLASPFNISDESTGEMERSMKQYCHSTLGGPVRQYMPTLHELVFIVRYKNDSKEVDWSRAITVAETSVRTPAQDWCRVLPLDAKSAGKPITVPTVDVKPFGREEFLRGLPFVVCNVNGIQTGPYTTLIPELPKDYLQRHHWKDLSIIAQTHTGRCNNIVIIHKDKKF